MDGVEEVTYKKKVVALVFRGETPVNGVKFLTSQENPFQIGLQNRPKNTHLPAHVHPRPNPPIEVQEMQEILFVISGKIRVNIVTQSGKPILQVILVGGDGILLMSEGHGVDFLEDSKVFEVKQGPYPGTANAKIFVKEK